MHSAISLSEISVSPSSSEELEDLRLLLGEMMTSTPTLPDPEPETVDPDMWLPEVDVVAPRVTPRAATPRKPRARKAKTTTVWDLLDDAP